MLIKCPECLKMVSSTALACPHCGYNLKDDENPQYHYSKPYIDKLKKSLTELYPNMYFEVKYGFGDIRDFYGGKSYYYTELSIDFDSIFPTKTDWRIVIIKFEDIGFFWRDIYVFIAENYDLDYIFRRSDNYIGKSRVILKENLISLDLDNILWREMWEHIIYNRKHVLYAKEFNCYINAKEIINDIKSSIAKMA